MHPINKKDNSAAYENTTLPAEQNGAKHESPLNDLSSELLKTRKEMAARRQKAEERLAGEIDEKSQTLQNDFNRQLDEEVVFWQDLFYRLFTLEVTNLKGLYCCKFEKQVHSLQKKNIQEYDIKATELKDDFTKKLRSIKKKSLLEYKDTGRKLSALYKEVIYNRFKDATVGSTSLIDQDIMGYLSKAQRKSIEPAQKVVEQDSTFYTVILRCIYVEECAYNIENIKEISGESLSARLSSMHANDPNYDVGAKVSEAKNTVKRYFNKILEPIGKQMDVILFSQEGNNSRYYLNRNDEDLIFFIYFSRYDQDLNNLLRGNYNSVSILFLTVLLHYLYHFAQDARISIEEYTKLKEDIYHYSDRRINQVWNSIQEQVNAILTASTNPPLTDKQTKDRFYHSLVEIDQDLFYYSNMLSLANKLSCDIENAHFQIR